MITVDDSVNLELDQSADRVYPAKKIDIVQQETDMYRNALRFGRESNFTYQAINTDGIALNAISYINTIGAFLGLKCTGITDPYRLSDLTVEEQELMQDFDSITSVISRMPIYAMYLSNNTPVSIKTITVQTEASRPSINGHTLVLTLNDAYLVEGKE